MTQDEIRTLMQAIAPPIREWVSELVVPLRQEVAELRLANAQLKAEVISLQAKGCPEYVGVWREGSFERGAVCTFDGSLWLARRDTSARPGSGDNSGWTLCVKRGAKGDSAYDVARQHGYRGTEQEWLTSLKVK